MCNIQQPTTGLEGKFSLRFTAALALADGERTTRRSRMRASPCRTWPLFGARKHRTRPGDWERGTGVTVTTRDGRSFSEQVNLNIPASDLGMQWERLEAKFRSLAGPVVGASATDSLVRSVAAFEQETSVRQLITVAANAPAGVA